MAAWFIYRSGMSRCDLNPISAPYRQEAQPLSIQTTVSKTMGFKTAACSSPMKTFLSMSSTGGGKFFGLSSNGDRSDTSKAAASTVTNVVDSQHDCPVDREKLGNSTWNFLHTMAAYVPDTPTREEQKEIKQFMSLLGRYYPCDLCAHGVREQYVNLIYNQLEY